MDSSFMLVTIHLPGWRMEMATEIQTTRSIPSSLRRQMNITPFPLASGGCRTKKFKERRNVFAVRMR